jgi:hypothetical protein
MLQITALDPQGLPCARLARRDDGNRRRSSADLLPGDVRERRDACKAHKEPRQIGHAPLEVRHKAHEENCQRDQVEEEEELGVDKVALTGVVGGCPARRGTS